MNLMPVVLYLVALLCCALAMVTVVTGRAWWCIWPLCLFMISGCLASFTGCVTQPAPQIVVQQPAPAPVVKADSPKPVDPRIGLSPEVLAALQDPSHPIVKQGIVRIYPYSENVEYSLTCATGRATEIRLNKDESFEQAALGDTSRWSVQGVDHAVMIKALGDGSDPKMATNLIIGTTKRSYHLNLKLGRFTPALAWYYPDEFKAELAAFTHSR